MRVEKDLLGELPIDENAYWGVHTERALHNFPFSGNRVSASLISAIAEVKKAATEVNCALNFLESEKSRAIIEACDEIIAGKWQKQFPLPALQGGAGTSTNMNINEVIANRAIELLGEKKGSYHIIHPIEMVNLHQSTNDVYPTALKIVVIRKLRELSDSVTQLQGNFQKKEQSFANIITIGRTQLQEAVPITLGSQFSTFAQAIERDRWRCFKAEERIRMVNIGGTAVGTGITAPRDYIFRVIEKLRENTGLPLGRAEHLMDATANQDCFVEVGAILLANATNLIKIARDLRFLQSQKEIILSAVQSGSSIMPTKVNPVILEAVISLGLQVKSNNNLLAEAVEFGSLQINEYMPLIANTIIEMVEKLTEANSALAKHVEKIEAGEEACQEHQENALMLITAFLPHLGYKECEKLIEEYLSKKEESSFRTFLSENLGKDLVEKTLKPTQLMALGYRRR